MIVIKNMHHADTTEDTFRVSRYLSQPS